MNKAKHIKSLINRYMDGDTSLDEEATLYAFFSREEIPAELEEYKDMFAGLASIIHNDKIKADIDKIISENAEEKESATISDINEQRKTFSIKKVVTLAAATAALAIGFFYISDKMEERRLASLYEGSYMIVNGKRIDDLQKIESDIERVLAYANEIEKSADINANIKNIEEELLNSIDDEERKEEIRQMLK